MRVHQIHGTAHAHTQRTDCPRAHPQPHAPFVRQVKQGVYAVYSAVDTQDALSIGNQLMTGAPSAVKAYCDATPACIGLSVGSDSAAWRAFSGIKWADAVGKVRVVGETLNGVTTVSA